MRQHDDVGQEQPDAVDVVEVPARSPDAVWAVSQYFGELARRFGFEAPDPSEEAGQYEPPRGLFLLVRRQGSPVACAGLRFLDDERAEVKRMWVAPAARGLGVASRLLTRLEELAASAGRSCVVLDTNSALTEAVALYERRGYQPVAPYNENADADRWFAKELGPGPVGA